MNKVKKSIVLVLMIILGIVIGCTNVNAVYFSSFAALKSSREFYCIEHQDGFHGGTWNPVSSQTITSDDPSQLNRALAYILYQGAKSGNGGYNYRGPYQIAVWKWYYQVGINTRYPNGYSDNGIFDRAMTQQSVPYSNSGTAGIEIGNSKIIMTGNKGSINFKQLNGTITSITIEWADVNDNNKTYTQTITSGSKINDWIEFYSDSQCTKPININEMKVQTVYFKNLKENYQVKNMSFDVNSTASGYAVTITRYKKSTGASSEQDLISASIHEGTNAKASKKFNVEYAYGKLRIEKHGVFPSQGQKKSEDINASFKLYCNDLEKWVSGDPDGNKTYVDSIDKATTYKSKTTVSKLYATYKYELVEVAVDNKMYNNPIKMVGVTSDLQKGLSVSKRGEYYSAKGIIIYADKTNKVTVEDERTAKVKEISGIVWVDKPDTKLDDYDYIYKENSKDTLLEGIQVNLYGSENKLIATTKTDSNGYYKFTKKNAGEYAGKEDDIYYNDLENAYVEFIYDNKQYVIVDALVGKDVKVNSKALENEMTVEELEDEKLTGTTGNLPGKAVTEKKADVLRAYYDADKYAIANINLGLMEKRTPEYKVKETLEYVKVTMKGYTYTYRYGDEPTIISDVVPRTGFQNTMGYTASIYPTDVSYNAANASDELKVYVIYSVNVENLEEYDYNDIYYEERLFLDKLENSFDTSRYELATDANLDDSHSADFKLWSAKDGVASYDVNSGVFKDGIGVHETKSAFIQLRVTNDALMKILTDPEISPESKTKYIMENAPTKAKTNAYHEYLRTDNVWVNNDNVTAYNGGPKGKGYPEKSSDNQKYYVHKSVNKESESSALFIKIQLGESRTLSGSVFEDKEEKDQLGNGIIDGNENKVNKVKVELLDNEKKLTKLYKTNGKSSNNTQDTVEVRDAVAESDENGNYTFDGVVPGYYYIRFTYGDGNQVIMPATKVFAKDYKSTIINTEKNDGIIKNAMEASRENIEAAQQTLVKEPKNEQAQKLVEWYKFLKGVDYSTATDLPEMRLKNQKYVKTTTTESDGSKTYSTTVTDNNGNTLDENGLIRADTPVFGISIENDANNETDLGSNHKSEYKGFNFGIITFADTVVSLQKEITNVKFTNQVGTTIVSANPTDKSAQYITALEKIAKKSDGAIRAKLEIEPESIYGSELEATYRITISAEGIDYIEDEASENYGDYYKYGDKTNAKKKEVTVGEVLDDIDEKYNKDSITVVKGDQKVESKQEGIEITNWPSVELGNSTDMRYTVKTLLTNENNKDDKNDSAYDNDAQVKSLSLSNLSSLKSNFSWKESEKETEIIIMPTTGEDRNNLYWIVGGCALGIMAAGIFLIIKKVLKK